MRWRGGLEIGHQSEPGTLPEVGVLMRALGRLVPELHLNCLDGVTSGRGLAGHRVSTDLMVTDLPEAQGSLHDPQGPRVGVDTRGEAPVLAEQELRDTILCRVTHSADRAFEFAMPSISLNSATKTTHRTNAHQLQLNVAYLF
jgi:hypothetical protein